MRNTALFENLCFSKNAMINAMNKKPFILFKRRLLDQMKREDGRVFLFIKFKVYD